MQLFQSARFRLKPVDMTVWHQRRAFLQVRIKHNSEQWTTQDSGLCVSPKRYMYSDLGRSDQ